MFAPSRAVAKFLAACPVLMENTDFGKRGLREGLGDRQIELAFVGRRGTPSDAGRKESKK
jgi:hypothetical protein